MFIFYPMGRITIKDIARLLELNPSTVSRALKDHPDISTTTRDHVKKVAKELGYAPNYQAISFRSQQSRLIGLIIPDMNPYFFPSIIKSIEEGVRHQGYNLIVLHSNNNLLGEQENVKICRQFGVEGLLVSLSTETESLDHFETLAEQGVPVVYFDRTIEDIDVPKVIINDEQVAFDAVHHLIGRGARNICGVFGDPNLTITKLRYNGFVKALTEHNLEMVDEFVFHAENSNEAREGMLRLINTGRVPDAIFSMSDEVLVGVMQAIQAKGIKVPGQTSIIAISNGDAPQFFYPEITYVEHSATKVGHAAIRLLFELIGNPNMSDYKRIIPTKIRTRSST